MAAGTAGARGTYRSGSPLPPDGPLHLVCVWPAEGLALTRAEIEAAPIREAAARAETLRKMTDGEGGT